MPSRLARSRPGRTCCGGAVAAPILVVHWRTVSGRRTVRRVAISSDRDALLVTRVRAGDDSALAAVYDEHAGLVYGLARRVTRDEELARDIAQEVFAYFWENPDRVDLDRGTLRAYLSVLAHRRAVDEVRRHKARSRAETASAPQEEEDGPEAQVVAEDARSWRGKRVSELLGTLPAEQREAVRLAYYEGLTYVQVANRLSIPEGTAKYRLRAALAKLRTLLTDEAREAIS
jgi:RNA polymerase sigma factor (sigma-70 family)